MKLEKREITLNEQDTLKDVCFLEERLLHEYVSALLQTQRKQTRTLLVDCMRELAEDIYELSDLLRSSSQNVGLKE